MTPVWLARVVFVLALLGTVSAYGATAAVTSPGESAGIEAFPPMPNDHPPGASGAARGTAAALGRGVNFGNMLDAPNEGDWGLTVRDEFIDVTAQAGFASVR